jgi:soluble lytic murein transglycosylase-like protein
MYGVDHTLVKAVIKAESNFNSKAVSRKGAKGLMQLMPRTASSLRVNDCFHPEDNIDGGVRYLRYLINVYDGNLPLTLAAYNAGEKAVARYRGIPPYPETQTYVRRVMRFYEEYSRKASTTNLSKADTQVRKTSAASY